jgi:hypothetical protein
MRAEGSGQWYDHDEIEESGEIGDALQPADPDGEPHARTAFGTARARWGSTAVPQYEAPGRRR